LHIVGGGVNNILLNQLTADACAIPIKAGPVEATAIGNVIVQAVATGDLASLAEARQVIALSSEISTVTPRDTSVWDSIDARVRPFHGS
jgi:rhamnulokinase